MNPSLLIGLTFALVFMAYFTARVIVEWLSEESRAANKSYRTHFQRVENVYPKYRHTP